MSNDTAIISLKEKIDDLNQQAWDVRVSDLPKSFELSEESVKLARSISYPKGLAEGLRSLGFAYVRFSKNDEAAPLLKESLSLFQSLNDLKGQAVIYEYLGIIERNWGNLGASLDLLLKANELVLQIDSQEIELTCSYQLGVTYKHLGNHENALDYLYKTLSLAKKINYPLMEAYATNIIGSIYFDNGNYNQALDCYQQGLPIRQQSHDKWGEAGSLDNIGFTYLKLNDLDKAIDHCKQSLAICQDTGDKKGEANALLHLGEIYEQVGDIKQAAGFSNESLEIRKARGDKRGETEVLLFLAELYKNRNDVEDHQIFEWLSNALKIADEVKAQDLLSKAYYNLHEYYQQKGNFKESLVQLEAHFKIEKELHKNSINQKIANLEISHKAEVISQRNKELTELNEKIEKANEEAQIQLALERVRARTMAMQHSDELKDAASLLFKQLEDLGIKSWSSGFNIWEDDGRSAIINMCNPDGSIATPYYLPHTEEIFFIRINEARQRGDELLVMESGGKDLEQTYNYMFSLPEVKKMLGGMEDTGFQIPKFQVSHCAFFSQGYLMFITYEPVPEMWDVFKRFAKVFEQTYTRFLDLQKAEAQSREAQIELALERVRARTMAMQKSDELREAVLVIYEQLQQLNFESRACNIIIIDKESGSAQYWVSGFSQEIFPESYAVPYLDHPYQDALLKPWKQGDKYVVYEYTGKMKQSFDEIFFSQTEFRNVPEDAKKVMIGLESVILSTAFISYGALQALGAEPLSEENANILKRFGKVFEQTYTRFLDLQKAEAQARESQIQLALERVRARTMAMQKSDELPDAASLLFKQIADLGIKLWSTAFQIWNADDISTTAWPSAPDGSIQAPFRLPYNEDIFFKRIYEARQSGNDFFVMESSGKELEDTYHYMFNLPGVKKYFDDALDSGFQVPKFQITHCAFFAQGYVMFITYEPVPEMHDIFQRFAKVFEQTYTRFLDLQKAEAQARESQIEAALERVRSRTMGMQKSEELKAVIQVVYEQFVHLNVHVEHTGFIMDYKERSDMHIWLADKHAVPFQVTIPYFDCAHWNSFNEAKEKGIDFFANKLSFEEKNKFYQDLFKLIPDLPEETLKYYFSCPGLAISTVLLDNVGLYIENFSGVPYSDEENKTLMRFGKVFQQTYTRFLDLQKAEAQVREAKIENALEKVRSRTMAMQKSDELAEVATILFQQVKAFGIPQWTCGFSIFEIDDKETTWYPGSPDGEILPPVKIPLTEHPVFISFNESRKRGDELFIYEKEGEYQAGHYKYMQSLPGVGEMLQKMLDAGLTFPTFQIDHVANFSHGSLVFITYEHFPEMHDIFKRFAKVFEQTYTRFLDLQKAEAQAKESHIEAALEKVRSRTLAMQKSDELAETAAEVFRQLIALGIEPNRLYIGIVKEETGDMEMWATDEDGTQVGKRFMFNKNENASVLKLYDGWKTQKRSVIVDMQGKELEDYFHYLNNVMHIPFKGGLTQKRRVQSVAYFSKGFIGMASPDGQGDETIQLLERFAAVFNLTFTRFNDLKLAEAHALQAEEDLIKLQTEKKRAEDALSELQVTQKQLIQSEKMASLGELTAGIAHEIQNPLNFVNNFSDVNKELLGEMKEEIEKGNIDEVIAIANDIISNEEKINHHGKRADAIVKGMLQHSRSSSGVKEPTDINELADEYLRLAYHGLRAKDKSFNATMKTDFDEAIGKVNVIPQEIGRVFLNLITNAFYVVAEKKKQLANGYEPTVTVTTKKESDKVVVSVKDNGNGIPQKVLDKIFQPFFTTKPTGQGTGLGLSLSYDIVKAHSGEIKVKTKDGEGSEFVISLPV